MKKLQFVLALALYSLVLLLAQPFLAIYLLKRGRKQPEYLANWSQRFLANVPRGFQGLSGSKRIWVHVVSVGETHAVSPLVKLWAASHPEHVWLFTSTTPTGQATARQLFSDLKGVQFSYLPYDLPWLIRRAIRRFNASQLWLVETELWPNLILQAKRAGVPASLVNARISPRSGRRLLKLSFLATPVLRSLHRIVCQTHEDGQVFSQLGRPADAICGNLKFDVSRREDLIKLGGHWRSAFSGPVLLFASSREGEEAIFLDALIRQQFFKRLPQASVWIVPRHPQRFDEVFAAMDAAASRMGIARPQRRSRWSGQPSEGPTGLVLGDSMGEMPAYYSAADLCLLGGSWLPFGGQNLIEACAYGCPVWMGPNTFNFSKAADDALLAGAARRFDTLSAACASFLEEYELVSGAKSRALEFAARHAGAAQATLAVLTA
ncbi:3-deoxy-D-manno-octulosonic acid transferase [Limnobacter sp.]|uniref:3-deoxy-D-manno-octulosonic acid transferase n=1 Tax=Limnobacter sp. TaxID=2003368 RepID=UPI002588E886|nr:3-deoxy-D-manno-octulosonic acid transferase [Limnobacter sp.]